MGAGAGRQGSTAGPQVHGGLRDGPIGDDPQLVQKGDGAIGLAYGAKSSAARGWEKTRWEDQGEVKQKASTKLGMRWDKNQESMEKNGYVLENEMIEVG